MKCFLTIVAAVLAGCQSGPELEVYGMEPGSGWRESVTSVRIDGAHFYPTVNLSAGETESIESAAGLSVMLTSDLFDDIPLEQVRIDGSSQLRAVVPSGLKTGTYGLEVFDTRGRSAALANAFEVTYSEVERFDLSATPLTVDAGEEVFVNVRPIASGTTGDETYQGAVAVRVHVEPIVLDDATTQDFLSFSIDVPNSGWVQTGFVDARPEFEGVLVGNEQFRIASNTEATGRFVVTELLSGDASTFGAKGDIALKWGQRDDLLLALDVRENGSSDLFDAPQAVAAGTEVIIAPRLIYANGEAVPSGGQGLTYLVQDKGRFLEPFVVVAGSDITPVLRQLRDATLPPEASDVTAVQFVAWELSEPLSLGDIACPPPEGARYSCSVPIQVYSGAAEGHRVVAGASTVRAGEELALTVMPLDAYGNRTIWNGSVSGWSFAQQGVETRVLDALFCPQPGVDSIFVTCAGIPTLADVTPIGFTDGLTGWSAVTSPVTVEAGVPHTLGLDVRFSAGSPVSQVEAGQPVEVEIAVSDMYGNTLMGSALDGIAAGLTWSGVQESPDCTRFASPVGASGVPEVLVYECILTRAEVGHNIQAHYSGITGFSAVFDVVPGPLKSVSVDLLTDTSTFVAGDVMEVLLTAYDAFGNHLVSPVPNGIDASTDPESQAQSGLITDSEGKTSTAFVLTTSGITHVVASYFGDEVGRSVAFNVQAGPPDSLDIVTEYPWSWVNEAYSVIVHALDEYGNIADLDETVTLTSANGEFTAVTAQMLNGIASVDLLWTSTLFEERVDAISDSGYEASAQNISIVKRCVPSASPTMVTSWNGLVENGTRRACHDLNGEFSVQLNVTGSAAASGGAVHEFVLAEREQVAVRIPGASSGRVLERVVGGKGRHTMGALVAQLDGCAVDVYEDIWTGFGVGVAVGPLPVEPVNSVIESGKTGPTGSTVVDLGPVFDCASDPASGARVFVRTDRAELSGGGLTYAATGGQYVLLDAAGEASVVLDAVLTTMGGAATVHTWNGTRDSRGVGIVTITGDDRPPIVFWQDPVGMSDLLVDSLTVFFSEPMLVERLEEVGNYELCNASTGALVDIDSVSVDSSAREAEVFLDSTVDLSADTWRFTLFGGVSGSSATWTSPCGQTLSSFSVWGLTDLGGLRLKEATSVSGVLDYTVEFGDVSDASPNLVCAAGTDEMVFRPDNDGNTEAGLMDVVSLRAETDAGEPNPVVWRMTIRDGEGTIIRREFTPSTGGAITYNWDGRDQSERVVSPSTYTMYIHGLDGAGNEGLACSRDIVLANYLGVYDE